MGMVGSRNLALDFDLARPGMKRGPYEGNGKLTPAGCPRGRSG
jgi:hypothetical protein